MSIEHLTRQAFLAMVFWRLVGDVLSLPSKLIYGVVQILAGIREFFIAVERTVFYFELEAARRYKTLNGVDLAFAVGETTRYAGLDAGRARETQDKLFTPSGEDEE